MIQSYDRYRMQQEDEQDPLKNYSDSNAAQPEQPQPVVDNPAPVEQPQPAIKPYEAPKAETKPAEPKAVPEASVPVTPAKTFAQMEANGEARPPMPSGTMGSGEQRPLPPATTPVTTPATANESGLTGSNVSDPMMADVPPPIGQFMGNGETMPPPVPNPAVPSGQMGPGNTQPPQVQPPQVQPPQVQPPAAPQQPSAPDWLLSLLQGGAQGTTQSDLQKATSAKALDRLNSASPYDSQAVRDEYNYLAGNIDDDYAMQSRGLDDSFAKRGLYGSAGKDFHSGRLSDLNVGKRSAKTALAQDLANKFATTKGQYDAQAVDQANQIGQTDQSNKFGYINDLMGYGNDAFSHDLATAQFQQGQNESEQDYILRLLQLGYGV